MEGGAPRGGLRRVHVRGRSNVAKRVLVQAAAFNLALILRSLTKAGTPRGLANLNIAPSSTRILRTVATPTPFFVRSSEKRWITLVLSSPSFAFPSGGSMCLFQIAS